jgi:hypothetical protein
MEKICFGYGSGVGKRSSLDDSTGGSHHDINDNSYAVFMFCIQESLVSIAECGSRSIGYFHGTSMGRLLSFSTANCI